MRRLGPATAVPAAIGEPIAALNITPLIDVMLVLLVILTLPQVLHEVPLDVPQSSREPVGERVVRTLDLARTGAATLDGAAVADAALHAGLAGLAGLAAVKAEPASVLVMHTDPQARYERFDQTLAVVKRAGITRLGFVGNGPL